MTHHSSLRQAVYFLLHCPPPTRTRAGTQFRCGRWALPTAAPCCAPTFLPRVAPAAAAGPPPRPAGAAPARPPRPPLTRPADKARLLHESGADHVVFLKTDTALLSLSPGDFFERVIRTGFEAHAVVEGYNFRFGKD